MQARIEKIIREWPLWSRHDLAKMDDIVAEVIDHCINGGGNGFIREFVNRFIVPHVPGFVVR